MSKIFTLFTAFVILINTSNAALNESKEEEKEIFHTTAPAFESTLAGMVTNLNRKELEKLTGRRLTLGERVVFTLFKLNTRHQQKRVQTKGFNAIGFFVPLLLGIIGLPLSVLVGFGLLGLLLSLFGVAGTYALSKDKNMHKWAWIGFGVYCLGIIVLIILILNCGCFG